MRGDEASYILNIASGYKQQEMEIGNQFREQDYKICMYSPAMLEKRIVTILVFHQRYKVMSK